MLRPSSLSPPALTHCPRAIPGRCTMKTIAVALALLPLAFLAGACTRDGAKSVAKPEPQPPSAVAEAAWVTDRNEVTRAASIAAQNPLVRAVLREHESDRLTYAPEYALRGRGRTVAGRSVTVTILPYVTDRDETHGTFVSLLEVGGEVGVSHAEIIWGRDPRSDEVGYEAFMLWGRQGWIREDDLRAATVQRDGSLSPERVN